MLLIAFGTRPEKLKLEPLFKYWNKNKISNYGIFISGQHIDTWNECIVEDWEYKNKIINIDFPNPMIKEDLSNRLDNIIIQCMKSFSNVLDVLRPEYVLVQGDTATAYACALSAFQHKIKIIHLEAGLRSYDKENPYPEEFYRRSISLMTDIHLCPTEDNKLALIEERASGVKFVVGNTILDTIKNMNITPSISKQIICTLHRRENIAHIKEWFLALEHLAQKYSEYKFILPIHKNPEIYKYKESFKYVKCIDPLEHNMFLKQLAKSALIITDSGGICEELCYLGKKMFIARKTTERQEAYEFYTLCESPEILITEVEKYLNNNPIFNLLYKCPFGNGESSTLITNILKEEKIINV